MMIIGSRSEEKMNILALLKVLTIKIFEEPPLANLLFAEVRAQDRKGAYTPLQICLYLLIKEEIDE
jgi:hypothetical protein